MKKHEMVLNQKISAWDNDNTFDRYTVVYLGTEDRQGNVLYLSMSHNPFHPQGFCQHGDMPVRNVAYKTRGGCFDKRIPFDALPEDCQKAVLIELAMMTRYFHGE